MSVLYLKFADDFLSVALRSITLNMEASSWTATKRFIVKLICGKTGIRTREALSTLTRFPDVPLQPLEHLSKNNSANIQSIFVSTK